MWPRLRVGVGEAGPRERDAARAAAAGQVLDARSRGRRRAGRGRTRPGRGRRALDARRAARRTRRPRRPGTAPADRAGRRRGTTSTGPTRRASHRVVEHRGHRGDLVGRSRRASTRRRPSPRGGCGLWPDERGEVDAGAGGVDRVAVAGVVGPRPRHAVVEQVARDVLDVGEEVGDVAAGRSVTPGRATGCSCRRASSSRRAAGRGRAYGSQNTCGSVWAWVSMNPGVTTAPAASISGSPSGREVGADLDDAAGAHAHVGTTGAVRRCRRRRRRRGSGSRCRPCRRPPPLVWGRR